MTIRSLAYRLVFAASLAIDLPGGLSSNAGQIIRDDRPTSLTDVDLSVFEARLRSIAEEYRVEFKPEGQAFSGAYGDAFLVRMGENTGCTHTEKCVYVLFRNAEDKSPIVTICKPVDYDLVHGPRNNGMFEYRFYFFCGIKSKLLVDISSDSVFVGSATQECADRLTRFVHDMDELLAAKPRSVIPLLDLLKKYFPLRGCDVEEAVKICRSSKYVATIGQKPDGDMIMFSSETFWNRHSGFTVGFSLLKPSGDSDLPYAMVNK